MSVSQAVSQQLPYLRRFARAVTGSQTQGDHSVKQLLMALPGAPSKLSLFAALSGHLLANGGRAAAEAAAPDRALAGLTSETRQAFLLSAVEGFAVHDIAVILNVGVELVEAALIESRGALAESLATDVLVIEDEPLIALELEDLVAELGHNVVGVARTRDEAVALAAKTNPQLCLADIQLADNSSGIDAVNQILAGAEIPVIFITAFPEKFLTGARPEPAFLISKPFDRDAVQAQISQALFFEQRARKK